MNEFDNQPITLEWLNKKQKSACHHVSIAVEFKDPTIMTVIIHDWDKRSLDDISSLITNSRQRGIKSNVLSIMKFTFNVLLNKIKEINCENSINEVKLRGLWDRMIQAKQQYEKAGGKYE